jgi:ubiquitin carboxyl-terminal hydrolase L5
MNIIINRNDINLGPELANFRSVTQNLSPMDRGLALDDFGHIRDVHNSFAT